MIPCVSFHLQLFLVIYKKDYFRKFAIFNFSLKLFIKIEKKTKSLLKYMFFILQMIEIVLHFVPQNSVNTAAIYLNILHYGKSYFAVSEINEYPRKRKSG